MPQSEKDAFAPTDQLPISAQPIKFKKSDKSVNPEPEQKKADIKKVFATPP